MVDIETSHQFTHPNQVNSAKSGLDNSSCSPRPLFAEWHFVPMSEIITCFDIDRFKSLFAIKCYGNFFCLARFPKFPQLHSIFRENFANCGQLISVTMWANKIDPESLTH